MWECFSSNQQLSEIGRANCICNNLSLQPQTAVKLKLWTPISNWTFQSGAIPTSHLCFRSDEAILRWCLFVWRIYDSRFVQMSFCVIAECPKMSINQAQEPNYFPASGKKLFSKLNKKLAKEKSKSDIHLWRLCYMWPRRLNHSSNQNERDNYGWYKEVTSRIWRKFIEKIKLLREYLILIRPSRKRNPLT